MRKLLIGNTQSKNIQFVFRIPVNINPNKSHDFCEATCPFSFLESLLFGCAKNQGQYVVFNQLTAISLIWSAIIVTVVCTIADVVKRDTPSIIASKFCLGVTSSEQASHLITVVSTVIVVITAIRIAYTSPIAAGESCWLTGMKSWRKGMWQRNVIDRRDSNRPWQILLRNTMLNWFYLPRQIQLQNE